MIELKGTLTERLEAALSLVCAKVTEEQMEHFRDIYEQAGIKPSDAAAEFFGRYGGAYRENYIMLPDAKYNKAIFVRCYGNDSDTGDLEYAMQYMDVIREAAQQEVCPVALIGFDIPADVYIGENGLLYCLYEFKEEIDVFESPAQILEYYLKNSVPIGVDKKPIVTSYEGLYPEL